jgi:transmembrane sensor
MAEIMWGQLGRKIDPGWGPERDRAARLAIARRRARRRAAMHLGAAAAAVALVSGGWLASRGLRAHVPPAPAAMASAAPGSTTGNAVAITQLSPETILEPMPDRGGRGFVLRSGGARFMVSHDPERPFVVAAGDVRVEDLGTTFTVRYMSDEKVHVAVEEGRVRVHARGAVADLTTGDEQDFAASPLASMPGPAPHRPGNEAATPSWRLLAESGQYDEAHAVLKRAGPSAVRDETADLLLAADAARLSGHPAAAVPYLERVVRSHASDPRAGLASFTLGRVLLEELGRPREAADAFARAREAGGPLAEDALAREVEATARAGDTVRSRELAREYQTLYPNGRRAKSVSRWGGLD